MSSDKPKNKQADEPPAAGKRKGLRALKLGSKRSAGEADTSTPATRREARKAEAAKAAAAKAQATRSAKATKTVKAEEPAKAAEPGEAKPSRPSRERKGRMISDDARKLATPLATAATESLKLGREMLVIPAQVFMAVAEFAGAWVLWVWRRIVSPAVLAVIALLRALLGLGQRYVTPARGVAVVAIFAAAALGASQWLDYRGVSVGTDAYSGSVGAVAPAPQIETQQAGEAHAWVIVPLALAAMLLVAIAMRKRAGLARLLIVIGVAVIAISLVVDMPKGLDEGEVAIAYAGAEARLLDGFWMQIVTASVLIACGALLPRYLRSKPAAAPLRVKARGEDGGLRKLAAGARGAAKRAAPGKRKVQGAGS